MRTRDAIVAAARGCIGARFRPHGRDPAFGLDCVGVVAIAYAVPVPADYALRGGSAEAIARLIDGAGFARVDRAEAGDLQLIEAGPGQLHLVVRSPLGFVHADAGLRRVVEVPGDPAGVVRATWEVRG